MPRLPRDGLVRVEQVILVCRALLMSTLFVLALLTPSAAKAQEFFASLGRGTFEKCGQLGCWEQPPLPNEWKLTTGTVAFGVRLGSWEVAYRDLGHVLVYGFYVPDQDYNPQTASYREGARQWRGVVQQETKGLSLVFAPRYTYERLQVGASLGVLLYRLRSDFEIDWVDGGCCSTHISQVGVSATPMWGVSAGVKITRNITLQYSLEQAYRVRYGDAPAGGGGGSRPGVTLQSILVRYRPDCC